VADGQSSGSETAENGSQRTPQRERWYQRPTVRALKSQAESEDREFSRTWDERENDTTRLPKSETVHLGGIVLTEAFTPSTVSSLYRALERWPSERPGRKQELLEGLARSRGGSRGGWQHLGVVRRPGTFVVGDGHHDPDLPAGMDAVWLHVSYVTPALAMVVATFTLTEDAGDLSQLLRHDYRSELFDTRVRVYGRFGDLRARIPWARPARHGVGYSVSQAGDEKRKACQKQIRKHEEACTRWIVARFPGRFAEAKPEDRPVIRMLLTKEQVPYGERHAWLRPVGLEFARPLWRSTEARGWWLSEDRSPYREGRHVMTLAARRADAAEGRADDDRRESNWVLTQRFGTRQAPLAARQGITALLALYANRLGDLRDSAGVGRFPRRPVREARDLDHYLIRDGLDAATVTSDLEVLTRDLTRFRWGVPEFIEHLEHLPGPSRRRDPLEYVPSLCAEIRERAGRLAIDTTTTTGNIKASAELRQAIANTTLQRFVLALSFAATIIAIISLLTAHD
jgi:hypothetical protein